MPAHTISPQEISETRAAYVRYLFHESNGLEQECTLSIAGQPIPESAMAISTGIYFLTADQEDRLHNGVPPKILQDQCQNDDRVVYALVAESDALEDGVKVQTILNWLSTFTEDWLGIDEYTFYYSGNRSVHLHTEKFIPAGEIDDLRELAEKFNEMNDAQLDTSIYKKNAQFRLIGAKHRKTGLYKAEISHDADRKECIRKANGRPERKQWPYELPPPRHHGEETLAQLESQSPLSFHPAPHYRPGTEDMSPLPPEIEGQVRRRVYNSDVVGAVKSSSDDSQYAKPFSPYKKTGGEKGRSVIVMGQVDGIRQDRRSREFHVPAQIRYAIGGGDGSFTRANSESLVTLSPIDYQKWEYTEGDRVIIIGGNSGSSRIFGVDEITARLVATALESKGRRKALEVLSNRGFDIGSSGYNPSQYHDERQNTGKTEAEKIQRAIENGTRERNYDNMFRVSCRLLKIGGWNEAYRWCRNIFEGDFDSQQTYENLKGIVEWYDDYSHVRIPETPGEVDS